MTAQIFDESEPSVYRSTLRSRRSSADDWSLTEQAEPLRGFAGLHRGYDLGPMAALRKQPADLLAHRVIQVGSAKNP